MSDFILRKNIFRSFLCPLNTFLSEKAIQNKITFPKSVQCILEAVLFRMKYS